MHSLVNEITLSPQEKQSFAENGFIKLKNLLTTEATDKLRQLTSNSNQMKSPPKFYSGEMSKIGYEVEEAVTQDIYFSNNFKYVFKQLTPQGVAFIQGMAFELKANQKGFNWHHDLFSLCYVMPDDLAYTLWIPLEPINTKEQHGGMAYVSRKIHSAREYFNLVYQLVQQDKYSEFSQTEDFKNFDFQYPSKVVSFILDNNKVEDDFELGDALLLDKFVWHKSCPLKQGALSSRMAYVMRFVDCQARYSKTLIEGTYSLLEATGSDVQTDIGYRLAKHIKDGEVISDKVISLKRYSIY